MQQPSNLSVEWFHLLTAGCLSTTNDDDGPLLVPRNRPSRPYANLIHDRPFFALIPWMQNRWTYLYERMFRNACTTVQDSVSMCRALCDRTRFLQVMRHQQELTRHEKRVFPVGMYIQLIYRIAELDPAQFDNVAPIHPDSANLMCCMPISADAIQLLWCSLNVLFRWIQPTTVYAQYTLFYAAAVVAEIDTFTSEQSQLLFVKMMTYMNILL